MAGMLEKWDFYRILLKNVINMSGVVLKPYKMGIFVIYRTHIEIGKV